MNGGVDNDPSCLELKKNLPGYDEQIDNRTYISLFYTYRNKVVHEAREPGDGTDMSWVEPSYLPMKDLASGQSTLELVYPAQFFFQVCSECIEESEKYFLSASKSPKDSFKFNDAW